MPVSGPVLAMFLTWLVLGSNNYITGSVWWHRKQSQQEIKSSRLRPSPPPVRNSRPVLGEKFRLNRCSRFSCYATLSPLRNTHDAPHVKTWRHSKNKNYTAHCNIAREGQSPDTVNVKRNCKVRPCGFWDASWQTKRQTNKETDR